MLIIFSVRTMKDGKNVKKGTYQNKNDYFDK